MEPHRVIECFITKYRQRRPFFREVAEICHDQCRDALMGDGIQHIASFRAKHPDRLRDKLLARAALKPDAYCDEDAIEADIVDLAGVRIALYFPGDAEAAVKVLSKQFQDVKPKTFPRPKHETAESREPPRRGSADYPYRFAGYSATHLRVRLKPEMLPKQYRDDADEFAKARIEIQIASVFMHAWAEVEHDLVYKGQTLLSRDEYSLLDQVNGLAFAAEVALEQLQRTRARAAEERGPFRSHYELASYLHSRVAQGSAQTTPMGRADRLLTFLRKLKLDTSADLERFVRQLRAGSRPLVDQMIEAIVAVDSGAATERQAMWRDIEKTVSVGNPYESTSESPQDPERFFRKHWITFRDLAHLALGLTVQDRYQLWVDTPILTSRLLFDEMLSRRIIAAYDAYTRLTAGTWNGADTDLERHAAVLEEAIRHLHVNFSAASADRWSDS